MDDVIPAEACLCVCSHACMLGCVHGCMHLCVCSHACMLGCVHGCMHLCVCSHACMLGCVHRCMHLCVDIWLWKQAEKQMMTPRGFGQKEEFYWRGGMAITFCIMTITSYRDVEAAGVRNMGPIWRWAEVAVDGRCGFREVFNLYSRSDAPLNKRQKGAARCICRAVSTCGWKYEGVILCWLLFLCWAHWVGWSVNVQAWGILAACGSTK